MFGRTKEPTRLTRQQEKHLEEVAATYGDDSRLGINLLGWVRASTGPQSMVEVYADSGKWHLVHEEWTGGDQFVTHTDETYHDLDDAVRRLLPWVVSR